jgi:hypothetical protein
MIGRLARQRIATPLDGAWHWPERDEKVMSSAETACAQEGLIVRVEVPEEIWAGESRPIYAVLNGPYNDDASESGGRLKFYCPCCARGWLCSSATFLEPSGCERGAKKRTTSATRATRLLCRRAWLQREFFSAAAFLAES